MTYLNTLKVRSLLLVAIFAVPFSIWGRQLKSHRVGAQGFDSAIVATTMPTVEQIATTATTQSPQTTSIILADKIPTPAVTNTSASRIVAEPTPALPAATLVPTNTPEVMTLEPTLAALPTAEPDTPPTVAILEENATGILLGGSATPNSTISVLTNNWTVGVIVADEFGRWELPIFFPTAATYEIFARQLDSQGMEIFKSNIVTWQTEITHAIDTMPENSVRAVSSAAERCEGDNQSGGVLLPQKRYRIGVCQSLTDIGRHLGIYLELLLYVNPQIENPSLIHPGQTINLP